MRKRERELKKLAAKFGRHLEPRGKHWALVCDRGERPMVTVTTSPSCSRSLKNMIRDLRNSERKK
jgi:hypothetical protein